MSGRAELTRRFEDDRDHLRSVAYRMLGSLSEAEDAVQETWLRLNRADVSDVDNLTGWLTTVIARVCLNLLRARRSRREEPLDAAVEPASASPAGGPEDEALLSDSVGVGLLVMLDTLTPAERLAFVLHDMFSVPFDDIAPLVERTPAAARQLASRARRRVRGGATVSTAEVNRQRHVVDTFLAAVRNADFDALIAVLDPDVTLHADRQTVPTPEPIALSGSRRVARTAMASTGRALFTGPILLDGAVGLAMAPHGRLRLVMAFTITDGMITGIDVIADPDRLRDLELAVLD